MKLKNEINDISKDYYNFIMEYTELINKFYSTSDSKNEIGNLIREYRFREFYPWKYLKLNNIFWDELNYKDQFNLLTNDLNDRLSKYLNVFNFIREDLSLSAEYDLKNYYKINNIDKTDDEILKESCFLDEKEINCTNKYSQDTIALFKLLNKYNGLEKKLEEFYSEKNNEEISI